MSAITIASSLFDFILNAAWQIALVYLAAWLMARLMRPLGAHAEHRVWVGALLLELLLPLCRLHPDELLSRLTALLHRPTHGDGEVRILFGPGAVAGDRLHVPTLLMLLSIALYLAAALFFAARLAWGLWKTHQLVRASSTLALPADAAALWTRILRAMQLSAAQVEIAVSPSLRTPMTVGLQRSWLLLPSTFLHQMSTAELEAACAHECAHMRRHDFAKNLLYSVITLPIAFHPLVWRTLAGMRESRELICDDLAASTLASQTHYARSLLRLAERLTTAVREPGAMHAIGIFDANIFERRIMRLTHPRIPVRGLRRFTAIALCVLSATAICSSALAWRIAISPGAGGSPMMADPPKRIHVKADVLQGNLISQVQPVYPQEAKEHRIEGKVTLKAIIGKEGAVEELMVQDGPKELQQSALDAVRQWKYRPYLLNGNPIEVESTINVIYSLGK
ncbi:MAG TPA: M56 family metallopeptidase [Acidobacteriaceae bacterium]